MRIQGSVALVTGAHRGIGRHFVTALIDQGAAKVYATARDPHGITDLVTRHPGKVEAVPLDVTNVTQVMAAAHTCADVTLLINNAGVNYNTGLLAAPTLDAARHEMEVNYFGLLHMCRAFAPILKANGGGALVNLLTVVARVNLPLLGSYAASKAAAASLTQGIRAELAAQGTLVVGVYPSAVDTDMTKGIDMPKLQPSEVVMAALQAVEADTEEIDIGAMAISVAQGLRTDPKAVEKQFATYLPQS